MRNVERLDLEVICELQLTFANRSEHDLLRGHKKAPWTILRQIVRHGLRAINGDTVGGDRLLAEKGQT